VTYDGPGDPSQEPIELLGVIARDTKRLLGQHLELVRSEVQQGMHEIPPAIASIGAGAALVATGGLLASHMLVHGLHRSSRIPLWGCYGVVGGLMATLGIGLMTAGAHRASNIRLLPRETLAALQEDAQWIEDQVIHPPTP